MRIRTGHSGYVLIPILVAVTLVAVTALLLSRETAITADSVSSRIDQDQLRLSLEAGVNHMEWSLQNANCTGYAAMPTTAFSGNNYSATVNTTAGSPVDASVTATLASGDSRSQTFKNLVVYAPTANAVLQPSSAGKDNYVDANNSSLNYGKSSGLDVNQASGNSHALLHFDVSFLPRGTRIEHASLELNVESNASTNSTAQVDVHRALQSWTEGTGSGTATGDGANYATSDGATAWSWTTNHDVNATASAVVGTATGLFSLNVTELINMWVARRAVNYGFVIKGNAVADHVVVTSSEGLIAANRPRLRIDYSFPCGSALTALPQQLLINSDTELDGANPTFNYGAVTTANTGNSDATRSMLRADFSGIPATATLSGASLFVYVTAVSGAGAADGELNLFRTTTSWLEGSLTGAAPADGATWNTSDGSTAWATLGGDKALTPETTKPIPSGYTGWVELDITALAQGWIDGTWSNFGVILTNTTTKTVSTATRENTTTDFRPHLFLRY